ncbi:MAG: NAD-dependent succinate-semialdehyde dehydrogenase [Chloroflexota bacterium]
MKIRSVNPFTEQVTAEFELMSEEQVARKVQKTRDAFRAWSALSVPRRAGLIRRLGEIAKSKKRRFAELITVEMGKPIRESLSEVEKSAWLCDYYADNASRMLRAEQIRTEAKKSYVMFQPLGVVLSIMPWNFPFWQPFRFAVPAIAAGNCSLLKHASNVPSCALAIEEMFREAGFPEGVFSTLLIDSRAALKLIEDDSVDAVSLTGSNAAGEQVGGAAGRRIKKVVLELGGSDPFIVLHDADVDRAAAAAAKARTVNGGQSCIAAKRFIVMKKVANEFTERFIEHLRQLRMGDPMDHETDIGPVAKREILETLRVQLEDAREKGAEIVDMGHSFTKGLFFPVCVVLNARADMKVVTEEVFGPIAPIIVVKTEAEAVFRANDTPFGLGASVWSSNHRRAEKLAKAIDAGFVAINDIVKSDPRLPFGGVKKSGVGRELSHYGLKEFVNVKTVVMQE